MGRDNESDENITLWANLAKDEIAMERNWSFLKTVRTAETVAGVRSYKFPLKYKDEVGLYIYYEPNYIPVEQLTFEQAIDKYRDDATGMPKAVVQFGDSFQLWPIPDDAYVMFLVGELLPNDFKFDGDENEISRNIPNVLLSNITYRGFETYQMYDDAAYWRQVYKQDLTNAWAIDVEKQLPSEMRLSVKKRGIRGEMYGVG